MLFFINIWYLIYFYNFIGHPNTAPFWSASSHYTYINWDHPDEETDFYSETDVNGSWKLGDDLCKGLIFENKRAVQDALLHYCFRLNQTYKMSESKPEYFTAKCQKSVDGCPWRIRAHLSKKIGKWIISKWGGSHTCLNAMTSQDHKKMTSTFMSNYILGIYCLHMIIISLHIYKYEIAINIHYFSFMS